MDRLKEYKDLMIIDQLNEGVDWFTAAKDTEIAERIKATPTAVLKTLVLENACDSELQLEYAKNEIAFRTVNDNVHLKGDPRYVSKIAGYDKFDKNLHEVLSADDPVEKWIADFVKSDNPKFDGKSKKERINMALGAFYGAQKKEDTLHERREQQIVSLATKSADTSIVRFFIESTPEVTSKTVLEIKDLYEAFVFDLVEAAITVGSEGSVKCVKRWGACTVGKVYTGVWKPAARSSELRLDLDYVLPRATVHPIIFFDKNTQQLSLPKQFELL